MRKKHGGRWSQVFGVGEESGHAIVLLEWDSKEAFEGFLNDPMVKETMK